MKLWRTQQMEECVLTLAKQYPRVLVRSVYQSDKPIRLRRRALRNLPAYDYRHAAGTNQIDLWNKHGGVLLFHGDQKLTDVLPDHDAQVICEAPLEMDRLENWTGSTVSDVIVYKPLTWDALLQTAADRRPTEALAKRFYGMLAGAQREIPDEDVMRDLNLTNSQFKWARRKIFAPLQWLSAQRLYPRLSPTDKHLRAVYDGILQHPALDGMYQVQELDCALAKISKRWRYDIARMIRTGNLGTKGKLTIYYPDPLPRWKHIAEMHARAMANVREVIRTVDAAPVFQTPPRARAPRVSSAPAHGIAG